MKKFLLFSMTLLAGVFSNNLMAQGQGGGGNAQGGGIWVQTGDVTIDIDRMRVDVAGRRVELTPTEYKLLYHLVRNAGHTLQHGTLLAKVWGREYVDEVDYIRVYVRRLREGDRETAAHFHGYFRELLLLKLRRRLRTLEAIDEVLPGLQAAMRPDWGGVMAPNCLRARHAGARQLARRPS